MTDIMSIPNPRATTPAPPTKPTASPAPLDTDALVTDILGEATATIRTLFAAMDWAEEEIAAAMRRHPGKADLFHHCFAVLTPRDIGPGMGAEFVYRGHARELLQRAAAGTDLRWATAAEIVLALVETSKRAPMHGAAAGLYFRMWLAAFPDHPINAELAQHQDHYEHRHGSRIEELELTLRRKLVGPNRQLRDIECAGKHHGKRVRCTFAVAQRRPGAAGRGRIQP